MELPSLLQLEESAEAEAELGKSAAEAAEAEAFEADDGQDVDDGEDEESSAQEEVGEEDGEAFADSSDESLGPNKTEDKVMAQAQKDLAAMDKAIKAGDVKAVDKISAQTERAVENAVKVEQAKEASGQTSTSAAATSTTKSTTKSTTASTTTASKITSTEATTTTSSSSAAASRDVQPVVQATGAGLGAGPFEAAAGMRGAIDASVSGLAEVAEKAKSRAKDALGKLGEYQQTVQNLRPPLRTMSQQASELQDTFVKAWKADEVTRVAPFDSLDFGTAE